MSLLAKIGSEGRYSDSQRVREKQLLRLATHGFIFSQSDEEIGSRECSVFYARARVLALRPRYNTSTLPCFFSLQRLVAGSGGADRPGCVTRLRNSMNRIFFFFSFWDWKNYKEEK